MADGSSIEVLQAQRFSREIAAGYNPTVIASATVVLVGAGALGQFLALCLALLGFRDVLIIDMDSFEESNIARSPFYLASCKKADAVCRGARTLCTATGGIRYRFATCMVQTLGDTIFVARNTLVFSAVDNDLARNWLMQRTRLLGVPLIEGGFRGNRWNLSVFENLTAKEACWRCGKATLNGSRIFSCDAYAKKAEKNGVIPATAPGAMSLASAMIAAGADFLHGGKPLVGHTVFCDLTSGTSTKMRRAPDEHCKLRHQPFRKQDVVGLRTSPSDTVATLLDELDQYAVVELPATFVHVAPCVDCHENTRVEQPGWAVSIPVRCRECNGPFQRTRLLSAQHGFLSRKTSKAVEHLTLSTLGLGPGLHLNVNSGDRETIAKLAGSAEEATVNVASHAEAGAESESNWRTER